MDGIQFKFIMLFFFIILNCAEANKGEDADSSKDSNKGLQEEEKTISGHLFLGQNLKPALDFIIWVVHYDLGTVVSASVSPEGEFEIPLSKLELEAKYYIVVLEPNFTRLGLVDFSREAGNQSVFLYTGGGGGYLGRFVIPVTDYGTIDHSQISFAGDLKDGFSGLSIDLDHIRKDFVNQRYSHFRVQHQLIIDGIRDLHYGFYLKTQNMQLYEDLFYKYSRFEFKAERAPKVDTSFLRLNGFNGLFLSARHVSIEEGGSDQSQIWEDLGYSLRRVNGGKDRVTWLSYVYPQFVLYDPLAVLVQEIDLKGNYRSFGLELEPVVLDPPLVQSYKFEDDFVEIDYTKSLSDGLEKSLVRDIAHDLVLRIAPPRLKFGVFSFAEDLTVTISLSFLDENKQLIPSGELIFSGVFQEDSQLSEVFGLQRRWEKTSGSITYSSSEEALENIDLLVEKELLNPVYRGSKTPKFIKMKIIFRGVQYSTGIVFWVKNQ
jgi:hypothetical protein